MRTLLHSHIFLAACAVALTAETTFIFKLQDLQTCYYLAFVFFATIVAYNIKGALVLLRKNNANQPDKILWVLGHPKTFLSVYFFSVIGAGVLFLLLASKIYLVLLLAAILAVTYSIPFRWEDHDLSPRNIPFFKTILVAVVWTLVTVYIPCSMNGLAVDQFLYWIVSEFLFLFSLSILFDIKDLRKDAAQGVKTIPRYLGVRFTVFISLLLMLVRTLLLYSRPLELAMKTEAILSFVYLIFVVNFLSIDREEKFYMSWVDGCMLGKFFVFALFNLY
ncbi:MAG TPA: hypothetical protein VNB90_00665 [Cytophagaceae bacterium]|nr:hypothetical protein [Cytophagaceae bacterium]